MKKIKIPQPSIVATLTPETVDKAARTIDAVFYSGITLPRFSWERGEYMLTLSMEKGALNLKRLNSGTAPILETHSDWSTRDVLGVVEKGWVEDGSAKATMRFLTNDEDADRVWNKIEQKVVRNVSVGLFVHKMKETSEEGAKLKSYTATDWEPFEISVCPVGADSGAHLELALEGGEQEVEVEVEEFAAAVVTPEVEVRASAQKEHAMDESTITKAGEGARKEEVKQPVIAVADEQLNAAHQVGVTAEKGRITGIMKVAEVCHLEQSFAAKYISAGTTLETFREIAIDEQARRAALPPSQQSGRNPSLLSDEVDKRRLCMAGALLERFNPGHWSFDERDAKFNFHKDGGQRAFDGARQYAACTLLDIAKECLGVQKIRWQSRSRTEIAQLAFQSTSDFPFILADVAGKSLRAGYDMAESQWRLIAARRTAADFKDQKELTIDSSSRLTVVPESGEFQRGSLVEGKETYHLHTYGKIISITRQAIINDDLGAFTRTPMLLGQEVAQLEADTVYGIITANAAMRDTFALYGTDHVNLMGTPAVINVANLGLARVKLMTQTSPGGKVLGIQPRYLLACATIGQVAEQYCSSAFVAATSANINPLAGKLVPIIEPRLDASSVTAWYLFGDPNMPSATVLIYAYLEGQEGPYTETRNGFDVDGTEIKIRHDFAAAAVDYRGSVKNAGA